MKVLIPLAEGCEEMEAVIMIDVLRRVGWDVFTAGLGSTQVLASRGVRLVSDGLWEAVDSASFDMLLLPGGKGGTDQLCAHAGVQQAIRSFVAKEKWLGAICAAPLALFKAGVLEGRSFTCYPGVEAAMGAVGTQRLADRVVVDGRLVTSQGPGSTFEFTMQLIALGESVALSDAVRAELLV